MRRFFLLTLLAVVRARAQQAPAWPDTYLARLQALALLQTLNAELLASPSATLTLERWCGSHQLANEARIAAEHVRGAGRPASPEQRQLLQVTAQQQVKHRRVRLRCGSLVLSEADNWYVPARLTAEMNRILETDATPFGKAVQVLEPYRRTFSVKMLWEPLPSGWEARRPDWIPAAELAIPEVLLEHIAVLYTREHKPISLVQERYQRQILAFPPPP